jgi:hypothetical protein
MLDVPVVEHIAQLVVNLAFRDETERDDSDDDDPASENETDKMVLECATDRHGSPLTNFKGFHINPESLVTNDSSLEERKPKRIRRLNQDQRRKWRLYNTKQDCMLLLLSTIPAC